MIKKELVGKLSKSTDSEKASMDAREYWAKLSQTTLTDDEVNLYAHYLDWKQISKNHTLRHDTWVKQKKRIFSSLITQNKTVGVETFNELKDRILWSDVARNREIDDHFLLHVCENFSTLIFKYNNKNAHKISEKTWKEVEKKHFERFKKAKKEERENILFEQALPLLRLEFYAGTLSTEEWRLISMAQPLTIGFVERNYKQLHWEEVIDCNPYHKLTKEEIYHYRNLSIKT